MIEKGVVMNSLSIVIIVVLLVVITILSLKIRASKSILHAVDVMKDIFYYCEVVPTMHYKFISSSIDNQLGKGVHEEHLKNPQLVFEIVHPEDRQLLENKIIGLLDFKLPIVVRFQHKNGQYYWYEEVSTPIFEDGQLIAVIGVYRKIEDRMKKMKDIEFELAHDTLTEVYNRSYFEKMMEYYNSTKNIAVAMAIVDLDSLKIVNDRLGHRSGDEFISVTAKILRKYSDSNISVCRIGGDEFAIIFEKASTDMVEKYFDNVHQELELHQQTVFLTNLQFSMGYAICENSFGQMQELYEEADKNMYNHKRSKDLVMEFHI